MAALLSHNLVLIPAISAASLNDQKNYYSPPDPNIGTPSTPSGSHGSGGHHGGSSSHHHGGSSSHHGGGGSYGGGSPPSNCGSPPHHGGGGHHGGGVPAGGFGTNLNLLQALSNTRNDGFGELYREGTASLLNSMLSTNRFPYTTQHVRDSFGAALSSNTAAAAQARLFKLANEGRLKPKSL
nr:protodermal factor 1 [Ipomoea batatas]